MEDEGEEDLEAYREELERKCGDGDEEACEELEAILAELEGDEDEDERFEEYVEELERECEAGDEEACDELEDIRAELEGEEDDEGDDDECEEGETLTRVNEETGETRTYICEDNEWVLLDDEDEDEDEDEEDDPQ